jgi:superfamily II DNA helicase RecQ
MGCSLFFDSYLLILCPGSVCEKIVQSIPEMKNQITFYHANLPPDTREKRQKNWSKGSIKVIW